MSLKDVFQNIPGIIFDAFDDVPEQVSIDLYGSSEYDASTGLSSSLCHRAITTMVFDSIGNSSTFFDTKVFDDANIQQNDIVGVASQLLLGVVVKPHDKITRIEHYASVEYDVIGVSEDQAHAAFELHLRKI